VGFAPCDSGASAVAIRTEPLSGSGSHWGFECKRPGYNTYLRDCPSLPHWATMLRLKNRAGKGGRMNLRTRYLSVFPLISTAVVTLLLVVSAFADNPVPQVVGPVKPQTVIPGSGAFTLTVYGANFVSGAVVNWNRSPRSTTFISARELKAQILGSDVATATAGYITVTNPPPGGGISSSSYGLVEVHTPTKTLAVNVRSVVPSDAFYAITADLYGDGKLDLVSVQGDGKVNVNRGNGDGTFQAATTIGLDSFPDAGLAFGDFDGDGTVDLVYGWGTNMPTYLKVLLGEGGGRFRGLPRFGRQSNSYARGIVAGDFDGDGILDLADGCGGEGCGWVFHGNGDGTFQKVESLGIYAGGDMVGADFNGDGKLDLVGEYVSELYLFVGNGDGTFQKPRRIATDPRNLLCGFGPSLLVNDFNGDGYADLAFCDANAGRIGILLGNGDGSFQRPVYYSTGFGAGNGFTFTAGDFNSDGKTDLIASTPAAGGHFNPEFEVFWGNGDGTFQKAKKLNLPQNFGGEIGLIPGDFNSDGLLDFVMVNNSGFWTYTRK